MIDTALRAQYSSAPVKVGPFESSSSCQQLSRVYFIQIELIFVGRGRYQHGILKINLASESNVGTDCCGVHMIRRYVLRCSWLCSGSLTRGAWRLSFSSQLLSSCSPHVFWRKGGKCSSARRTTTPARYDEGTPGADHNAATGERGYHSKFQRRLSPILLFRFGGQTSQRVSCR